MSEACVLDITGKPMMVKIKFLDEFRDLLLDGFKTCTARPKRMGRAGDHFEIFGATFKIVGVDKRELHYVATRLYQPEGFPSITDFIECWERIHPRAGYKADTKVFVHHFRRVR